MCVCSWADQKCQEPSWKALSGACWECHHHTLSAGRFPGQPLVCCGHKLLESSCSRDLSWKSHLFPLTHCKCGFFTVFPLFLGVLLYKFLCEAQCFIQQFSLPRDCEMTQPSSPLWFQHLYLGARGCVWCNISFYFLVYRLIFTWQVTHPSLSVNTPLVWISSDQFLLSLLFCPADGPAPVFCGLVVTFGLAGTWSLYQ